MPAKNTRACVVARIFIDEEDDDDVDGGSGDDSDMVSVTSTTVRCSWLVNKWISSGSPCKTGRLADLLQNLAWSITTCVLRVALPICATASHQHNLLAHITHPAHSPTPFSTGSALDLCMFLAINTTKSASLFRLTFRFLLPKIPEISSTYPLFFSTSFHYLCNKMSEPAAPAPVAAAASAPAPVPASAPDAMVDPPKLSKKAMKKKRRYEKAMEIKRRRKEQEREQKRARALAAGRDLDEERRIQKQNEESGEGRRRREERWLTKMEGAKSRFRIAVDCGFEKDMTKKEINSLAQQLRYCYAANKRSKNPCYFTVPSLSGLTREHCDNVCGFPEQWQKTKAFDFSDKPLEEMHADEKDKLVYLTSDSDNTLEHLDDSKIYVIGGIVDRNRLKCATLDRAKELGIATAKLPISQHLKLFSTKVLTTNHVFEILLKYRENNNDWKQALVDVLPKRKDMKELDDGKVADKNESVDIIKSGKEAPVAAENETRKQDCSGVSSK